MAFASKGSFVYFILGPLFILLVLVQKVKEYIKP